MSDSAHWRSPQGLEHKANDSDRAKSDRDDVVLVGRSAFAADLYIYPATVRGDRAAAPQWHLLTFNRTMVGATEISEWAACPAERCANSVHQCHVALRKFSNGNLLNAGAHRHRHAFDGRWNERAGLIATLTMTTVQRWRRSRSIGLGCRLPQPMRPG